MWSDGVGMPTHVATGDGEHVAITTTVHLVSDHIAVRKVACRGVIPLPLTVTMMFAGDGKHPPEWPVARWWI